MSEMFSLLVIDDHDAKRRHIISSLRSHLSAVKLRISEAQDYESARDALKPGGVDFVVMDIKIPAGRSEPSEKWSQALLNNIVSGELCYPIHVFGLTQHHDVEETEREFYEQNMFGFFMFDWNSDSWAREISNKIIYIASALQNGAAFRLNSFDYDLLVVTARHESEFVPVKRALFGEAGAGLGHPLWKRQGSFFGTLRLAECEPQRAALLCVGEMGLAPTAAIASQAISLLRPRVVVMLGMCAGFQAKSVKVMDVLVARSSACWQEGKMYERAGASEIELLGKIRGCSPNFADLIDRQIEMNSEALNNVLTTCSESDEYLSLKEGEGAIAIPDVPTVRTGLIVSGSAVVADTKVTEEVLKRFPLAIGLEMEIFGLYTAVENSVGRRPDFVAIKTAADFGNSGKKDSAQKLASRLSAEIFKPIFSQMIKEFGRN
jgi:nucleoside phosphorylase/CheY-like chemotaxis protein